MISRVSNRMVRRPERGRILWLVCLGVLVLPAACNRGPDRMARAMRHAKAGSQLLEAGRLPEAVAELTKAVELHPENHVARTKLADVLLRLQPPQVDKAIENLRAIEEADPMDRQARLMLAKAYEMKGQIEEAIIRYEHLVFAEPGAWQLKLNLGQLYSRAGKFLPAQREFALLLRERPRLNEAYNSMGNLYNALSSSLEALECFERAAELGPGNFMGIYNLGLLYANLGDEKASEKSLRETLDLNPGFPHAHLQLGLIEEKRGSKEKATGHFMDALNDATVRPFALTRLAMQLIAKGQAKEAVQPLITATRYNPQDVYPWDDSARYLLADVLLKDNKEQDAVACLEQAIHYNPGAFKAMGKLADIYKKKGDSEKAKDFAERAKTMAAAVSRAKKAQEHFKAAFAASQSGQSDKARAEAVASNEAQESLDALLLLTRVDFRANKLDEAEKWASAASSLQPLSGMASAYRGQILEKRGKDEDAFKVLSDAGRVRPYDLAANLALARVALRLKKHKEAVTALQMVLALDCKSKEAASGLVAAYQAMGKSDAKKLAEEDVAVEVKKAEAAQAELERRIKAAGEFKKRVKEELEAARKAAAKAKAKSETVTTGWDTTAPATPGPAAQKAPSAEAQKPAPEAPVQSTKDAKGTEAK